MAETDRGIDVKSTQLRVTQLIVCKKPIDWPEQPSGCLNDVSNVTSRGWDSIGHVVGNS